MSKTSADCKMIHVLKHPASFRDPSGFVFRGEDDSLYRQVDRSYELNYRMLMESGLYKTLVEQGLLVEHEEVSLSRAASGGACRVLRPREIGFVSYPYEWPFSALKEAALLTLDVQGRAMQAGMSLKDASAYNVQFEGVRPVFIDTLSFEKYEPGAPWTAYGQFSRHFLAPLALMANTDAALSRLLMLYLDGIPLEIASKLLPWRTRLAPGLFVHLHLHAKMVKWFSNTSRDRATRSSPKPNLSRQGVQSLIESLRKTISKLHWTPRGTPWADYYDDNSYSLAAFEEKKRSVEVLLHQTRPRTVWDMGANTGVFSRIAGRLGADTCAFDLDPACVERNFRECRSRRENKVLPLVMDLVNPSPAIGWAHRERNSLADRGPADLVMALALVHHLRISNNLPFEQVAAFFGRLCRHLIIEFVPKHDPQVKRLLRSRKDVFDDYRQNTFEAAFRRGFRVLQRRPVGEDGRMLYLMETDGPPAANACENEDPWELSR